MKKINILGVLVNVCTMENTVTYLTKNIKKLKGKYICVSNVHTTIMSYEEDSYCRIQNNAIMVLPDGKPLSIVCKLKREKECERVTGPDLMENLFLISEKEGYTHFFYGSTNDTLEKLRANLKKKYPNIRISGMYSPPYRELSAEEDQQIIEYINNLSPDFLWVGLGAPKQEVWMYNHKDKINSLMIGVGAGFDYHANNIKRAPKFMQKLCLEWLYRLLQDPKRLFKRYFITNFKFIYLFITNKV